MRRRIKQAVRSDHHCAAEFQRRLRRAVELFVNSQSGCDEIMVISAVMTEAAAATFEMMNKLGYVPTEAQFVAAWSSVAGIVARGEHYADVAAPIKDQGETG